MTFKDVAQILLREPDDLGCRSVGFAISMVFLTTHPDLKELTPESWEDLLATNLREMGITAYPHSRPLAPRHRSDSWWEVGEAAMSDCVADIQQTFSDECPNATRQLRETTRLNPHNSPLFARAWNALTVWD